MTMFKHTSRSLFVVAVIGMVSMLASPTSAVVEWELVDESISLGMKGVSPHVEKVGAGDRVFRSDMVPAGTAVSLCTDAGACATESLSSSIGPVNDYAIAQTTSGPRAYFKKMDPGAGTQGVFSAACASADCLSFGAATLTSTGMSVSSTERAWGVPDPVKLPDGRIRIYIVESPSRDSSCPEKVASYISADGISFTKESGWRLEGGYVDTEVLRAKDGEWVMIMADGPGCPGNQKLYVSTSTDGLTWAKPQVLTGEDVGRLDPTGYEVSTNVFRIYYAAGSNDFTIKRAVLKIKQSTGGVAATGKTTTTTVKSKKITCVKGKTVKKVVGATCPKGFKKK